MFDNVYAPKAERNSATHLNQSQTAARHKLTRAECITESCEN